MKTKIILHTIFSSIVLLLTLIAGAVIGCAIVWYSGIAIVNLHIWVWSLVEGWTVLFDIIAIGIIITLICAVPSFYRDIKNKIENQEQERKRALEKEEREERERQDKLEEESLKIKKTILGW